jgi:uncharacterized membrane protein
MLLRSDVVSALVVIFGIGLALQSSADPRLMDAPSQSAVAVSFAEQVQPIFEARCVECHGEESTELGLRLDTYEGVMAGSDYGTVVEAGDGDGSLIIDMMESGDMPEDGDAVPSEEIELIKAWINEGAENN